MSSVIIHYEWCRNKKGYAHKTCRDNQGKTEQQRTTRFEFPTMEHVENRDINHEWQVIKWATQTHQLEVITAWLEPKLPPHEVKKLEAAFLKFLRFNPTAYTLMYHEYKEAYKRDPDNWKKTT